MRFIIMRMPRSESIKKVPACTVDGRKWLDEKSVIALMRKTCALKLLLLLFYLGTGAMTHEARLSSGGSVLSQPSRRLYKVYSKEGRVGFIDKTGKLVIDFNRLPAGVHVDEFSEGLASVQTEDGKAGYIDKSGSWVIVLPSAGGYNFREGLAPVAFKNAGVAKFGYIDRTGKLIIEARFDGAFEFIDGVAQVYTVEKTRDASGNSSGESGYIDKTGKYIWPQ
jgi:hypothetical protein